MTALSIQPPFPTITDTDGQPLENGYIWIGTANLPSQTNPISVYWDAALTQPAAQPIRTQGGYPVNSGTPARLYVNSDYSILVQNSRGTTVYSAPDGASDRFSAAQIGFIQAGSGAVARTAQDKMREFVTVQDFGAIGNGVADDTNAMSTALTAAQASGKTLIGVPGSIYLISTDFVISTNPVQVDFSGCVVRQTTNGRGFLQLRADGNDVRNVNVEFTGTRSFISGTIRYRGFSAWQRMCAVWVESGNNNIANITANNLNNSLCLRGPVVFNPAGAGYTGSDSDPNTAFFYTSLAQNNNVGDIFSIDCDFCITGHQQDSLEIRGYTARNITQIQNQTDLVPPHALYMVNPDGVTQCTNVFVEKGHCDGNSYGVAHKFIGFATLNIGILSATDCSGAALFEDCNGAAVDSIISNGTVVRLNSSGAPAAAPRYGAYIIGSRIAIDYLHTDGVNGLECGCAIIEGTSYVDISSAILRSRNPSGVNTAGVVRCEDNSETRLGRITHIVLGDDTKESIVAIDSAEVTCGSVRTIGTTRVARGEDTSQIFVSFDPQQIDNFDRATAFIGNVKTSEIVPWYQENLASSTTMYGATTAGTQTYTDREFFVIRKGDEVTIYAKFLVNGAFSGTGDVRIGPLPYAAAGSGSSADAGVIVQSGANITLSAGEFLVAAINDGESFIRLQTLVGLTKANLDSSAVGSSARVEFVITYRTTAAI